jgi:hypothetical protein
VNLMSKKLPDLYAHAFPAGVLATVFSIVYSHQLRGMSVPVNDTITVGDDRWHVSSSANPGTISILFEPSRASTGFHESRRRTLQEELARVEPHSKTQWASTDQNAKRKKLLKDAAVKRVRSLTKEIGTLSKAIATCGKSQRFAIEIADVKSCPLFECLPVDDKPIKHEDNQEK